jgi:hypothetical protein
VSSLAQSPQTACVVELCLVLPALPLKFGFSLPLPLPLPLPLWLVGWTTISSCSVVQVTLARRRPGPFFLPSVAHEVRVGAREDCRVRADEFCKVDELASFVQTGKPATGTLSLDGALHVHQGLLDCGGCKAAGALRVESVEDSLELGHQANAMALSGQHVLVNIVELSVHHEAGLFLLQKLQTA